MDTWSHDELEKRYRSRLLAEAVALRCASDLATADLQPVQIDRQNVGRLGRMGALQQPAMSVAQNVRREARLVAINAAWKRLDIDPVLLRRFERIG